MENADSDARAAPPYKCLVLPEGGGRDLLRRLDEGVHDVGPASVRDLRRHELEYLLPRRLRPHDRAHRAPPRRQLVDHRQLQIAVNRQRERARDRRRGHHQHVRVTALGRQGRALHHPEAVLLVDHHQPERGVREPLLKERVGADDQPFRAVGDPLPCIPAGRRRLRRGQQAGWPAGRPEEALEGPRVLLGQQLGWDHDRRLQPGLESHRQGQGRDRGLPGADVSLQQAAHRRAAAEVGGDLGRHPQLRSRQREGQQLPRHGPPRRFARNRRRGPEPAAAAAHRHRAREGEELVEGETAPAGLQPLLEPDHPLPRRAAGLRLRCVQTVQRGTEPGQAKAIAELGRDRVLTAVEGRQAGLDSTPQAAAAQGPEPRVDGHQALSSLLRLLELGVEELQALPAAEAELTEEVELALAEGPPPQPRLVEPDHRELAPAVGDHAVDDRQPAPRPPRSQGAQASAHQHP